MKHNPCDFAFLSALIQKLVLTNEIKQNYAYRSFSDGLGFTGVYIGVDIGVKSHEESKTSVVDVFELSKNLRRDRHGIVCTLEHYNFIYQVRKKLQQRFLSLVIEGSETRSIP